jgi:hypothetical protein
MTMKQQKTLVWHTVIVLGCILCLFALVPPQNYFNINAFQVNAPGTFGNTPKNFILGPPQQWGDAGTDKNRKIARKYNLQFRWDLFNVFNHPSFANPNASNQISATAVNEGGQKGQITATVFSQLASSKVPSKSPPSPVFPCQSGPAWPGLLSFPHSISSSAKPHIAVVQLWMQFDMWRGRRNSNAEQCIEEIEILSI